MSHPDQVAAHIQDSVNLYSDISNHSLPAVSVVKPSGYTDGHPSSSKLNLFEGFVKKIVDQVEASPYAKDTTKVVVTTTQATCSRSTSSGTAPVSR
jgi:phospholipase C